MMKAFSEDINEYLKCDEVIDFYYNDVSKLADQLYSESESETEFVKMAYEYVRDMISHSADISADTVTCSASEVLKAGHGICFAKSHLLAAILRSKSVPAGFCYQKLILDDETAPVLIYHGLNGVYLREYGKWIRLDARGNKPGVNAQFSIDSEMLAFPIRPEKGEVDVPVIYADPDTEIVKTLQSYGLRSELWDNLPMKLGYEMEG
jgi:transglutaminase-like putative cysteine protease